MSARTQVFADHDGSHFLIRDGHHLQRKTARCTRSLPKRFLHKMEVFHCAGNLNDEPSLNLSIYRIASLPLLSFSLL